MPSNEPLSGLDSWCCVWSCGDTVLPGDSEGLAQLWRKSTALQACKSSFSITPSLGHLSHAVCVSTADVHKFPQSRGSVRLVSVSSVLLSLLPGTQWVLTKVWWVALVLMSIGLVFFRKVRIYKILNTEYFTPNDWKYFQRINVVLCQRAVSISGHKFTSELCLKKPWLLDMGTRPREFTGESRYFLLY